MDLFPCVGSPLIASMPHFLHADPSLLENIASGLNPEKEKHIIYIDMETVGHNRLIKFPRNVLVFEVLF